MRPALLLVLLAAACTRPEESARFGFDATRVEEVVVRGVSGSVTAATSPGETVVVAVRARYVGSGNAPALAADFGCDVAGSALRIVTSSADESWRVDVEITAPPGRSLAVATRGAPVSVRGAWDTVRLATASGDIDVDAGLRDGGTISSGSGRVHVLARTAPRRDLACTSSSGDVALAVPAAFRGSVQLESSPDGIALAADCDFFRKWGPDRRSMSGFLGPPPSDDERRLQLQGKSEPPPGVWAKAPAGAVSFRLLE